LAPLTGSKSNQLYQELEKIYDLQAFIRVLPDIKDFKNRDKQNKQVG